MAVRGGPHPGVDGTGSPMGCGPDQGTEEWKEADWDAWSNFLAQNLVAEGHQHKDDIDNAAQHFFETLNDASKGTVPISKLCQRSKPGYTADLEPLRQQVTRARR